MEVQVRESAATLSREILSCPGLSLREKEGLWRFKGNLVTLRPSAASKELSDLAGQMVLGDILWLTKAGPQGRVFSIQENSFRFWRWLIGH